MSKVSELCLLLIVGRFVRYCRVCKAKCLIVVTSFFISLYLSYHHIYHIQHSTYYLIVFK